MSANHLLLTDTSVSQGQTREMLTRMEKVQGVKDVIGLETLTGAGIPEEILPDSVRSELESGSYRLTLISSEYAVSSDAVNAQIDTLNGILKEYDQGGMLIGEAPCTKDLIACTDHDFTVVSAISILAVFLIIALVLRSVTLPIILVAIIEFGIFFNLCILYYTGVSLPFVAPILISTIQLGATVDYAILMTTRYKQARLSGRNGKEAGRVRSHFFRKVHSGQRPQLLRGYIRRGLVQRRGYHQLHVRFNLARGPDQRDRCAVRSALDPVGDGSGHLPDDP